jgi:hypothetical protein
MDFYGSKIIGNSIQEGLALKESKNLTYFRKVCRRLILGCIKKHEILKDIAPALWGNPPLFNLAENVAQCREYHGEQLFNWSKVGGSLWLDLWGSKREPPFPFVCE